MQAADRRKEAEYGQALKQGSDEWRAFSAGRVGASAIAALTSTLLNGSPGAGWAGLLGTTIAGRLTGIPPSDGYSSAAIQWGLEQEPNARAEYQRERLVEVEQVGCIVHPRIPFALASPDGMVGHDGLVEIKCPMTHNHVETLLNKKVPSRYDYQLQWQLACTERSWVDFASYDPRLPEHMALFIKRVYRNDQVIAMLEKKVSAFMLEVDDRIADLKANYYHVPATMMALK